MLILKQIFHLVIYPVLPIFLNNFLQVMQNHNQIFFSKKNKRKTQTNKKQKSKMFCMKDVSAQYVHYKNEKL